MSVATLLIAGMSYGQCTEYFCDSSSIVKYEENLRKFQAIEYQLMDLIDAIRMDMYYGRIGKDNGNYYINEISKLQYENKLLMAKLFRNE